MSRKERHETVGTLKLTGEGIVSARPDVAELDLGVTVEAKSAGEAIRANAARMSAVIARIKALNIPSESLKTTGIGLSPIYDYDEKSPTKGQIIAYRVDDMLRVLSEVDQAGMVLDVAVSAGANLASGIRFALRDAHAFQEQALAAAVKAADRSATIVAEALGAKLDPPHQIELAPGDILGLITDGVRAFLRNQYRDLLSTDDMDAIVKKLGEGITLGSLTLSATAAGRYTRTLIDPGTCVSTQAEEQARDYVANLGKNLKDLGEMITFRGKTLSESLQSKGKISFTMPGAWFLGIQITPVLAFKIKGDKSGDYAIYGELQVEVGGKGSLKLKASAIYDTIETILNAKTYVTGIYTILDTARTAQKLLALISAAGAQAAGGGCSLSLIHI